MSKCVALLLISVTSSFGQNCIQYGTSTSLAGRLFVKDESGYNQFIALRLLQPICTFRDLRTRSAWEREETGVREIQAGVYGDDAASDALRDQLEQLVGHQVKMQGVIFHAHTGYHRTNVQLRVESVDAIDAAGRQALRASAVKFQPKEVVAYDVTINAARRLMIEVQDASSKAPLIPAEKYAPHWMTGGEMVYVDCLDGYERKVISTTEENSGICWDDDLCGFSAFPQKQIVIKFRCIKKP
jgi:hypothetical protein